MRQIFGSKLMKRNLIVSLLLTFLALAILFLITSLVMYQSVRGEIENRNQLMAKTLGKNTDYILLNMINDMTIVAEYSKGMNDHMDQNFIEMEEIIFNNPLYYYARIFNEKNETVANLPNVYFPETEEEYHIIERMSWSQTFYVSDMFTLQDGRETIAVSYPIFDQDGTYQGGVIGYINLHTLSRYLSQVKIGENGMNVLIDRDGNVIGSNEERYIGVNLADHELGENLYKDKKGIWDGEIFNKSMMFAYQPIQQGNFGVLVGEPVTQAVAPVNQLQKLLLFIFMIGLLLTFIFTVFATLNFVRPVTNLTKQVKEYREGLRTKFDKLRTGDELESLSIVLDKMAYELKSKEKYLSHILESIPYSVITTNKEGDIVTYNKRAEELTLYDRNELIGTKAVDLPFKKDQIELFNMTDLLTGNKNDEVESAILDKNGKHYDVQINSSLFYDEENILIGSILIIRDVTKLKKMEEDLKQAEYLASLGRLTAGVAHEIKNPLSIIQVAAEAIKLELGTDKSFISEMTDDILETSDRMNDLLTDFLKLSKGSINGVKEQVNVAVLLDELIILLGKQIRDQGIIIQKQYSTHIPKIEADKSKINQLFLNILINGIQALKRGGVLTIAVKNESSNIKIAFTDTGEGIDERDLKLIFDPFFTTKQLGTGLGLSIAYEIVMQHNGTIEAESMKGNGTTIIVYLPKL